MSTLAEITQLDDFRSLATEDKKAFNKRYWDSYAAENTDRADFAAQQRDRFDSFIDQGAARDDAAEIPRQVLDAQLSRARVSLGANEMFANGDIDAAGVSEIAAIQAVQGRDAQGKAEKTASLFDPEVNAQMQPAFKALRDDAFIAGQFGPKPLDVAASGILPFGRQNVAKDARERFESNRQTLAHDFNISEEAVDDITRKQMDLQEEMVSRDALGTPYIKNEVLAQGVEVAAASIDDSDLPQSQKDSLKAGIGERLDAFRTDQLKNVRENHPVFAKRAGIDVAADTPEAEAEQFKLLVSQLNQGRAAQFGSGFAAGAAASDEMLFGDLLKHRDIISEARGEMTTDDKSSFRDSVIALSGEINQSKTEMFGTDAAAFGQGAFSVAESVAIGVATGGASAPFSAARIASLGPKMARVANFANRASKVAPVAGFASAKQAKDTYASSLDAGFTPTQAAGMAARSAAIEFGVTSVFSGTKFFGGVENVGAQLAKKTTQEAVKRSAGRSFATFGGKAALGITGEQFEENMITALDSVFVQAKLNPDMSTEDLQKALIDTARVTLAVSAPTVIGGQAVESFSKTSATHDTSTPVLNVEANLALADAADPITSDDKADIEEAEAADPFDLEPSPPDPAPEGATPTDTTGDGRDPATGAPEPDTEGGAEPVSATPEVGTEGVSTPESTTKDSLVPEFTNRDETFWGITETSEGGEFGDGSSAVQCTGFACAIQKKLGPDRVKVMGFMTEDNPGTEIETVAEGHDFAVVDGRYIVDPWIAEVEGISDAIVFDLQDEGDQARISSIYGDQTTWEEVPAGEVAQNDSTAPSVPTTPPGGSLEEIGEGGAAPAASPVIRLTGGFVDPEVVTEIEEDLLPAISDLGEPNPLNPREVVIDGVKIEVSRAGGSLRVNSIENLESPGEGRASKALREVLSEADRMGVSVKLGAKSFGVGGMSDADLKAWYARLGFKEGTREGEMVWDGFPAAAPEVDTAPATEAPTEGQKDGQKPVQVDETPSPSETLVAPEEDKTPDKAPQVDRDSPEFKKVAREVKASRLARGIRGLASRKKQVKEALDRRAAAKAEAKKVKDAATKVASDKLRSTPDNQEIGRITGLDPPGHARD